MKLFLIALALFIVIAAALSIALNTENPTIMAKMTNRADFVGGDIWKKV